MIVVLKNDVTAETTEGQTVIEYLAARPGITPKVHAVTRTGRTLTEIYVVGDTSALDQLEIEALPGVEKVVRVSRSYAVIDPAAGGRWMQTDLGNDGVVERPVYPRFGNPEASHCFWTF